MKNETSEDFSITLPLTIAVLETIKVKGFLYVQVKGFTSDKKLDYIEPRCLVSIPMKTPPEATGTIEYMRQLTASYCSNGPFSRTTVCRYSSLSI